MNANTLRETRREITLLKADNIPARMGTIIPVILKASFVCSSASLTSLNGIYMLSQNNSHSNVLQHKTNYKQYFTFQYNTSKDIEWRISGHRPAMR